MTIPPPSELRIAGFPTRIERTARGTSVFVGTTEHRMPMSDERLNARRALLAASEPPSMPDRAKFESYDAYALAYNSHQREVLDPLRDALRALIVAEELAFIADLKDVYS